MAVSIVYIGVALCLLAFVLFLRNSLDRSTMLATPTIPIEKVMLTSYASSIINASSDEVFDVLSNYKAYYKWSTFTDYEWEEIGEDGMPLVGSKGTFKVSLLLEGLPQVKTGSTRISFWNAFTSVQFLPMNKCYLKTDNGTSDHVPHSTSE
jgi:hypothetical protein